MKKWITILLMLLLMMPLFATNGDVLNIGGIVPLILNLTVAPSANSDNLTLVGDPATPVTATIAGLTIETNNSAGWELWVYSNNADGGSCALINDDADEFSYVLDYTGSSGTLSEDDVAVAASTGTMYGEAESGAGALRYDDTGNLEITYTPQLDNPAGYYTDQLTIVLRAK